MSMTASKALAWAASQIGYTRWDDPEEGSLYGRWYAKKHGAYYGTSGVPFCAMFASWCLTDDDGASVIPGGDFAYVPYGINAAARAGQLVSPMTQAAPGDLVCFDWDGDGLADHVGIVEANYGGWIQTIEGNTSSGTAGSQSNGGGVWRRSRDWDSVIGTEAGGVWGDASDEAHDRVVGNLQRAVGVDDDEIYGPTTNNAINTALAGAEKGE